MGDLSTMPKWAKYLHLAMLLTLCSTVFAMVPPHPMYGEPPETWQPTRIEMLRNFAPRQSNGTNSTDYGTDIRTGTKSNGTIPQNILAVMVEFSDLQFRVEPAYPDYLAHDAAFFERWMLHLADFFADASHNRYEMNYTVYPQAFQLPNPLSFYGGDTSTRTDANLPQILPDLMELSEGLINYGDYDGLIIFHAGQGQEADIDRIRTDSIWSTFLTRRILQAAFDPENDDYPGFQTPDGAILTNVVIVPEDQYHDYFPGENEENASAYLFSIYGVLAHQFGHVLGLPTLFDNDSSNGASQGIGNWGLMGTGVWNASGYVPAQLSAWSRYYLGWEDAVEILYDSVSLSVDHFLNHQQDAVRLYKIPVSSREYFLIENRQQNPDGSLDPYQNLPSYTFKLLPEGEQDYYADYPLLPYFNFSKNRYLGSEWDFFLPGFGMDPTTDGSGILIWHIDENVIEEKFTENFDLNRINGEARHKGVDLEEADGYQNLDTAVVSDYKYGGPDDSFRQGNNDYFGNGIYNGLMWLPTAESYYGGTPLEIYDISASGNVMSFSVRFAWRLDAGFEGKNTLPAAAIDMYQDGTEEIFYPMPNGKIALFSEDTMAEGYPLQFQEIVDLYTWDGENLYLPMQENDLIRLARINGNTTQFVLNLMNRRWIDHPVDAGDRMYLPIHNLNDGKDTVLSYNKASGELSSEIWNIDGKLATNLSYGDDHLYAITKSENGQYSLAKLSGIAVADIWPIDVPADSLAFALFHAPLAEANNIIVQCPSSVYVFELGANGPTLRDGFPFVFADSTNAPLTIQDWDSNGTLDIIIGTSNRVYIVDHKGGDMSAVSLNMGLASDEVSAGAVAIDIDGDGRLELMSSLNMNRLAVWEESLRLKSGYPISFANRGRHLPFVAKGADDLFYLWMAGDNGSIFRSPLPNYDANRVDAQWVHEYANLRRTASRGASSANNQFQSSGMFVKDQLYFYPNPLKKIYDQKVILSVMPTRDLEIELAIYDISGNLVYKHKAMGYAYLRNLELFRIPVERLGSGIYIAMVSGGGETHRLRFGIEK